MLFGGVRVRVAQPREHREDAAEPPQHLRAGPVQLVVGRRLHLKPHGIGTC